ncbi:MAG: hypothetical protein HUJ51_00955 [Eggerthellaceae bacterium]|nr:hypothetical protein [Eggerthellaceae bacterium]
MKGIYTEITLTASEVMQEAGNSIFSSVIGGVIDDTFEKKLDKLKVKLVESNNTVLVKIDDVDAFCENSNSALDKI